MRNKLPLLMVAVLVFLPLVGWGYYAACMNDYIQGDAISRVANAFYVLYSRDPHLGAIGFVWNPLPSLLEMLPLLVWKLWPPVAASAMAGVVVSAASVAAMTYMLYRAMSDSEVPLPFRLLVCAGFAYNPFIFMYGANGMSEMMFAFSLVWAVLAFTEWASHRQTGRLISLGLALAAGFWTRYEAVAFGAAAALCVVVIILAARPEPANGKLPRTAFRSLAPRIESSLLVVLLPPVFSGLVWMLMNQSIMGDPLYFLHSGYSNSAFVKDLSDALLRLAGNPYATIAFVLRKSLFFSLPLLALLLMRVVTSRWKRRDTLALLALSVSIPAMQAVMLLTGKSYGWLRFFVYVFIVAVAWIPYEWRQLRKTHGGRRAGMQMAVICAGVLLSSGVYLDMNNPGLSPEEYGSLHMRESGAVEELRASRDMARHLDAIVENGGAEQPLVLADSFGAFMTIVNMRHPESLVITNDRDFNEALNDPAAYGIDYILLKKSDSSVLQVIQERYPDLFDHGAGWAELAASFNKDWRLYKVVPDQE